MRLVDPHPEVHLFSKRRVGRGKDKTRAFALRTNAKREEA